MTRARSHFLKIARRMAKHVELSDFPCGGVVERIADGLEEYFMNCPHCHKDIPDELVAEHLARKGGKAAKGKTKRRGDSKFYAKLAAMRKNKRGGRKPRKTTQ